MQRDTDGAIVFYVSASETEYKKLLFNSPPCLCTRKQNYFLIKLNTPHPIIDISRSIIKYLINHEIIINIINII